MMNNKNLFIIKMNKIYFFNRNSIYRIYLYRKSCLYKYDEIMVILHFP